MKQRFVVTGGAGFVGSHVVLALAERDADVVVIDNLQQGHRAAVPPGVRLVECDLADTQMVDAVLADGPWDAMFHFASLSLVGESMRQPLRYLIDNARNGMTLIDACVRHGISRFVLSSTANLFGNPTGAPITEAAPLDPSSPYGESKLIIERALRWADEVHGLRSAALRYFNAAGSDPAGRAGEDHDPETHLIPLAIDTALGRRAALDVYGTDYPTSDGSCIRDYIHVSDLAEAHIAALGPLASRSGRYNLGSGHGHSVLEVVRAVERITGRTLPTRVTSRRAGDPATLVASSELMQRETGWKPSRTSLSEIVGDALAWREAHPYGYGERPRSALTRTLGASLARAI